jgi:hypothetical protein
MRQPCAVVSNSGAAWRCGDSRVDRLIGYSFQLGGKPPSAPLTEGERGFADQYFGRKRSSVPGSARVRYMVLWACTRLCCGKAETIFIPYRQADITDKFAATRF